MQKMTIDNLDLDLDILSYESKFLIIELTGDGFSPKQIKDAMEDGEYLKKAGISQKISEEVHFFLCSNWETIKKRWGMK